MSLLDDILRRRKLPPAKFLSSSIDKPTEFHGFSTSTIVSGDGGVPSAPQKSLKTVGDAINYFLSTYNNSSYLGKNGFNSAFFKANPQFPFYKGVQSKGYWLVGFTNQGYAIISNSPKFTPSNAAYGSKGKPLNVGQKNIDKPFNPNKHDNIVFDNRSPLNKPSGGGGIGPGFGTGF